jgi:hypothetical protein
VTKSNAGQLCALSELGTTVWANRHHDITAGRAGHDEYRAAGAAAAAQRRGMTHSEIAFAMHLTVSDITTWLGPESAESSAREIAHLHSEIAGAIATEISPRLFRYLGVR